MPKKKQKERLIITIVRNNHTPTSDNTSSPLQSDTNTSSTRTIVRDLSVNTHSEISKKRSIADTQTATTTASLTSNPMNDLLERSYPNKVNHQLSVPSMIRNEGLNQSQDFIPTGTDSDDELIKPKVKKCKSYFDESLSRRRYSLTGSLGSNLSDLSDDEIDDHLNVHF